MVGFKYLLISKQNNTCHIYDIHICDFTLKYTYTVLIFFMVESTDLFQ